jgi:large subunit ribosomal protein L23
MKKRFEIIKSPHLTEKANSLQEDQGKVVIKVNPTANKIEIKEAVESLFNVKVGKVQTTKVRGKMKRVGKHFGRAPDWKKATITLTEGKINFLDEL